MRTAFSDWPSTSPRVYPVSSVKARFTVATVPSAAVIREGYWSGTTWSRRKNGSLYREWRSVRAVREGGGPVTHYVIVFYEVGAAGDRAKAQSGT